MAANNQKIHQHSIKDLYSLALAEGEGVGTAYEYFTKRLHLVPWLRQEKLLQHILIAGLPEKYGTSLDFILLASEVGNSVTLIDERPFALDKAKAAVVNAQKSGYLGNLAVDYRLTTNMGSLAEIEGHFDLILSSETLQRLAAGDRKNFISRLFQLSPRIAIFTPNNDNPAHTNQSGLTGLRLDELERVIAQNIEALKGTGSQFSFQTGYIDMPPFPPGITRTEEQREHASSGKGEAIAMWGLGYYARLERFFPLKWRRRNAHIIFAFIHKSQR